VGSRNAAFDELRRDKVGSRNAAFDELRRDKVGSRNAELGIWNADFGMQRVLIAEVGFVLKQKE